MGRSHFRMRKQWYLLRFIRAVFERNHSSVTRKGVAVFRKPFKGGVWQIFPV